VRDFINLANSLDLSSNIIWKLEHINDDDLILYFAAADVVIFPYQWIYQSGAVLMAMNFSKPIVATCVGSMKETIQDGKSGILIPLDDPDSMAQAILAIINDSKKAVDMGNAAYEFVTEKLSWDEIGKRTLEFYQEIL
jgi:glycosyltransferase involved in cell wall biosynthesis